jgi:hypothetical protein
MVTGRVGADGIAAAVAAQHGIAAVVAALPVASETGVVAMSKELGSGVCVTFVTDCFRPMLYRAMMNHV